MRINYYIRELSEHFDKLNAFIVFESKTQRKSLLRTIFFLHVRIVSPIDIHYMFINCVFSTQLYACMSTVHYT